ncbi:hypothetical protein BDZ89DRAFT_1138476 [Hymenopellis radicata]|nr:hypothetical protein BDZ89DRAFT_1138476 [Hymenopellis radicata]
MSNPALPEITLTVEQLTAIQFISPYWDAAQTNGYLAIFQQIVFSNWFQQNNVTNVQEQNRWKATLIRRFTQHDWAGSACQTIPPAAPIAGQPTQWPAHTSEAARIVFGHGQPDSQSTQEPSSSSPGDSGPSELYVFPTH